MQSEHNLPVLNELAQLINSITFESSKHMQSDTNSRPSLSEARYLPNQIDMQDILQSVGQFPTSEDVVRSDHVEFNVIRYGTNCIIKSKQGRYLTAVPITATSGRTNSHEAKPAVLYSLGVEGQGVGDSLDSIILISADSRDENRCVRYGDVVCLKSPAAKERYLGTRDGTRLGFWRNIVGQCEKWVILKGSTKGTEESSARGMFVRTSDGIMLQTFDNMILSLSEGIEGKSAKLVHKDRAGVGGEIWQLDWCSSQPTPAWLTQRPYLCGQYLMMSADEKYRVSSELEGRTFPSSSSVTPLRQLHDLKEFPPVVQEGILIRELMLALIGVEGVYVRVGAVDRLGKQLCRLRDLCVVIDSDSGDRGLSSQMALMLPICESANRIRDFIRIHSRYEYGTISHAVSASIKDMMREFDLIITQLENLLVSGRLSLQKIIFLLQPTKMTLRTIDSLISRVQDVIGGEMIDRIHCSLLEQGNEKARKIHEHILIAATAPFLKMLSLWLYKGVLSDPYNEFFISENTSMLRETLQEDFNAHYWESRYTLRPQHIPRIMKSHGEKALTAGKYLNVILDCIASSDTDDNLSVMSYTLPPETPLVYDIDGTSNMIEVIDKTYQHSSAMLLRILEEKFFLSLHIRSLRRFFLLEHGDFFVQFMDTAHDELTKDVKDVGVARVQGLLQLAVHTSTLANDPNRDDLSCVLASHNLIQHLHLIQTAGEGVGNGNLGAMEGFSVLGGSQGLKGVEALTLEYKVGWPISIILSKRAITKYQLLSRLLFFSKHVEDRVLNCWQDHQNTKELGLRAEMGPSYCLRHRMLHFLQNFVYYMTIEVFTPRSHEMMQAMTTACDMDEMLRLHELFLDTCLKECLLASQDLLRILTKLTTTCLLFADQMKRFAGSNEILDRDVRGPKEGKADAGGKSSWVRGARIKVQAEFIAREVTHEAYVRMLDKFSVTFDSQLREFLEKLWTDSYRHHPQLANLCVRLDYNGFYDSRFADNTSTGSSFGRNR